MDRSWEDFEIWEEHWKSWGGLLPQALLYISRTLWHYQMVWKSYEIFNTSDLHNWSENEKIICFRVLTLLHQTSECKVSQFRDTVALYGQHSGPFCLQDLLLSAAVQLLPVPLSVLWVHSPAPLVPQGSFTSTRSTTIFAVTWSSALATSKIFFPRNIGKMFLGWYNRNQEMSAYHLGENRTVPHY